MWIDVYPNWKMNFDSKNGRTWSFSFETKAKKSFISISRMWLWCPIKKRKEIIMWIHVYLNGNMNFNSKTSRKRNCSYETKTLISFIPTWRMWLWCPILKRKEIISESIFIPIERRISILKIAENEVFLTKPIHQNHLSQ